MEKWIPIGWSHIVDNQPSFAFHCPCSKNRNWDQLSLYEVLRERFYDVIWSLLGVINLARASIWIGKRNISTIRCTLGHDGDAECGSCGGGSGYAMSKGQGRRLAPNHLRDNDYEKSRPSVHQLTIGPSTDRGGGSLRWDESMRYILPAVPAKIFSSLFLSRALIILPCWMLSSPFVKFLSP